MVSWTCRQLARGFGRAGNRLINVAIWLDARGEPAPPPGWPGPPPADVMAIATQSMPGTSRPFPAQEIAAAYAEQIRQSLPPIRIITEGATRPRVIVPTRAALRLVPTPCPSPNRDTR